MHGDDGHHHRSITTVPRTSPPLGTSDLISSHPGVLPQTSPWVVAILTGMLVLPFTLTRDHRSATPRMALVCIALS